MSVLQLHKELEKDGVSVNSKSLYRLASTSEPLQKIDVRIVKAICKRLEVAFNELIQLNEPELRLLKLDSVTQKHISQLLDKNSKGTITARERATLERLVEDAEKVSLHNARVLVEYKRRQKAGINSARGETLFRERK
jgi:hypothetical protein